jgi:hypothetical protein
VTLGLMGPDGPMHVQSMWCTPKVNGTIRYFTHTVIFLTEKLMWTKIPMGEFVWTMLTEELKMWKKSLVPSVSFSHLPCMDTAFFVVCIHFLYYFITLTMMVTVGQVKSDIPLFLQTFLLLQNPFPLASTMLHTPLNLLPT